MFTKKVNSEIELLADNEVNNSIFWEPFGPDSLRVFRATEIDSSQLPQKSKISVKFTYDSIEYQNSISLILLDCPLECASCASEDLVLSNVVPGHSHIAEQSVGCTACHPGDQLKFVKDDSGSLRRTCESDQVSRRALTSCSAGFLYSEVT